VVRLVLVLELELGRPLGLDRLVVARGPDSDCPKEILVTMLAVD